MNQNSETKSPQSNSEGLSRDFKGIWIPREIWLHPTLSMTAKILWAEIDSLYDRERGGCFASNDYLMEFLGMKKSRYLEVMKELRDADLLEDVSFDGRRRVVRALKPDGGNQGTGKPVCRDPENRYPPIYKEDNKEEKKDYIQPCGKPHVSKSLADAELLEKNLFDRIKKNNPKAKNPKPGAWAKDIEKLLRIDKRTKKEVERAIAWVSEHTFWQGVILSGKNLRDNFDRIVSQMCTEKKNPKKQEKEEEKEKADRIRENKAWAKELLEANNFGGTLTLRDYSLEIRTDNGVSPIGFNEHGFKDQVANSLRKLGLL